MEKPEAVKAWEYAKFVEEAKRREAERQKPKKALQGKPTPILGGQDADAVRRYLKEHKDA